MSDDDPKIDIKKNGPLVIKGVSEMIGPDGEALEAKPTMFLCRCGHSANKPFCDGSHSKIDWDGTLGGA